MSYTVSIENKYIFKNFFRLFENVTYYIIFIQGYNESYIKIYSDSIEYYLIFDNIEYNFIVIYNNKNIIHVCEYAFEYSIDTCLWRQIFDYEHNININQHRQYILSHLQNYFYNIDMYWTQHDFIYHHWIYYHLIAFKQKCTPRTKTILQKFIICLRKNIQKRHIFNTTIIRRKFSIWKDWYFNPDNVNGFMKYIKNEYKIYIKN